MSALPVCTSCGRERTADDFNYSPAQVILGRAIGWYSGDDGEICGQCMEKIIRGELLELLDGGDRK